MLGQWQAGGYFTAQSGAPFTVNISSDQANIGAGPAQRPNVSGRSQQRPADSAAVVQYVGILTACAVYLRQYTPRNTLIGPGLAGSRFFPTEGASWCESPSGFSSARRPTTSSTIRTSTSPTELPSPPNFGSISSAQDSRQFQFALKLLF